MLKTTKRKRRHTRTAAIRVEGAYGELSQAGLHHLEACLAVDDPSRFYNRAYKEGRWDGKQRLYRGRRFPAGLTDRVVAHLRGRGFDVTVNAPADATPLDLSRFDATYLGPIGPDGGDLWAHQVAAVRTLLSHSRGIIKVPTGGGKSEIVAAGARYLWEERGWRSLIVVPKKGLLDQTVRRLDGYYGGVPTVGQFGDGIKREGDIIVGTAQTLSGFQPRHRKQRGKAHTAYIAPDQRLRQIVRDFEVLWFDEAQHTSSEQWFDIAMASRARRRYGLSGTPLHDDEIQDLRLIGATGGIICEVPAAVLIALGLAAKPLIAMVMAPGASHPELPLVWRGPKQYPLPYQEAYQRGVVDSDAHNTAVVRAATWCVDRGRRTLVLCRRKDHWRALQARLDATGLDFHALWGDTEVEVRNQAKRELGAGHTHCVLATTIWDEGEDVPAIGAIVLAEGVKTPVNTLQRVGRGMRAKRAGDNTVWVVDFVPLCHPKLHEHAALRSETYEAEGYEVVAVEDWPADDATLLPFERWAEQYVA